MLLKAVAGFFYSAVAAAVQDARAADDVLPSHQAGDGSHSGLPVAPAQRDEDPGDQTADLGQDGVVDFLLAEHPEGAVHEARSRW